MVWLFSGSPGAGKSTVCCALLRRFPFGLHIPVDDLRELVVSGRSSPVPEWTDETTRQFDLARRTAARMARLYHESGFEVAIDDVIEPSAFEESMARELEGLPVRKVLLMPRTEVAHFRNRTRIGKPFDPRILDDVIDSMPEWLHDRCQAAGWECFDTSELSVEQTVSRLLEKSA